MSANPDILPGTVTPDSKNGTKPDASRGNHTAPAISGRTPPLTEQVSFIIQHKVKPDHHDEYEAWLRKTIAEAAIMPPYTRAIAKWLSR